jgi:outer membrane cobalamin receptor
LLLALILLQALPAPTPTPAPTFEDQVVVTATRGDVGPADLPLSTTVLDRQAVAAIPALALDDLVRSIPGLDLPLAGSLVQFQGENRLSMRGLGGSRVLVLRDGVPLLDPFFGYVQWHKVPPEDVERIEVVRGASASLWGNYSMGGTLNVFTRPLLGREATVSALYGSHDTRRLNLRLAERRSANLAAAVSVDWFDTGGFVRTVPEDRTPADTPVSSDALNVDARVDWGAGRYRGDVRAHVLTDDLSLGTEPGRTSRDILDVSASLRRPVASGALALTAFLEEQSFDLDNTEVVNRSGVPTAVVSNHHDTPIHDLGFSLQWTRQFGGRVPWLVTGLDLRRVSGEDRADNFDIQSGAVTLREVGGGTQRWAGLFAETSLRPVGQLDVNVSARIDGWQNLDGRISLTPGTETLYEDTSRVELNPRLALRQPLGAHLAVRGAAYRAFRAPTLNEQYRPIRARNLVVIANPDLDPERLDGADVGFDLTTGRVRGQLNFFIDDVEDLVTRSRIPAPRLTFRLENIGATRSQGLEAFFDATLPGRLALAGSYAYADATITDNPAQPALVGNEVPLVSPHTFLFELRWKPQRFEASLRGRHLTRRYADTTNLLLLDTHTVVDARLSWQADRRLELYAIGENLFDEDYLAEITAGRRLGAPRQISGGVKLRWSPAPARP